MTARNRAIRTTQLPDDQTARSSPPLPCGPPPLPPPPCSSALSSCPLEVVAGDSWSARLNIKRAISVVLYIVQDPISYCQLSDYERIESDLLYSTITCKERKKTDPFFRTIYWQLFSTTDNVGIKSYLQYIHYKTTHSIDQPTVLSAVRND